MYQFVEDLKEEQYKNFIKSKNLRQKRLEKQNSIYIGVAKDRKLVACCKIFLQTEDRKTIFSIPLGIQTIVEDVDFYSFFMKYLLITAKNYRVQKIKIYSKQNDFLLKIGFHPIKKNSHSYLPLKKEKKKELAKYLQIVDMNTDRKRKKLKELKKENLDLFLYNNIIFFALQLDLYTYLDSLENNKEKEIVETLIQEIGDALILESISIEIINDEEAQYIETEKYSTLFKQEEENILFESLKQELVQRGIKKLFFPNTSKTNFPLEQEFIVEYEYDIYNVSNLLKRRGD